MDQRTIDGETLRRILLEQPDPTITRVLAVVVSVGFLVAILHLVRRGRLREEYTPIWTIFGFGIVVLGIWFDGLWLITRAVGAWTASSTLFFFGEIFLLVLCLNYAVRLSNLTLQMKNLAQEVAMLRAQRDADIGGSAAPHADRV